MNNLNRRFFLGVCAVAVLPMPLYAASRKMTAGEAHAAAKDGKVLLVDIRSRGEWKETGLGISAHAVSMHEAGFLSRLDLLINGDKSKPIALICAVGGRSKTLQGILTRMGYSNIIDVSEGMIGGVYGPGWIKSGLPIKAYQ